MSGGGPPISPELMQQLIDRGIIPAYSGGGGEGGQGGSGSGAAPSQALPPREAPSVNTPQPLQGGGFLGSMTSPPSGPGIGSGAGPEGGGVTSGAPPPNVVSAPVVQRPKADPGAIFATPSAGQQGGAGGGIDPRLLAGGGGGARSTMSDVSTIGAPERAELQQAQGERGAAIDQLGKAQVGANEQMSDADKYLAVQQALEESKAKQAEGKRRIGLDNAMEERRRIQQAYDNPDVAKYDRRSFGAKQLGAIGIALNAFGNALAHQPGAPNLAHEIVAKSIDADYQQQLDAIKEKRGQQREKLQGQDDLLSRLRESMGDDRAAEAQFRAMRWQQYALQAKEMADRSQSPIYQAKATMMKAEADRQTAQEDMATHHLMTTGGGGPAFDMKKIRARAADIADKSGGTISPDAAFQRAFVEATTTGGSGVDIPYAKPAEGAGPQKTQEQVRSYDNAITKARQVEQMIMQGGEFSPARTAQGKALISELVNEIPKAQLGTTRAPSESEQGLVREGLPADPNAFQFTGAGLARIRQTIKSLEDERAGLTGQAPPQGVAALGGRPVGQ